MVVENQGAPFYFALLVSDSETWARASLSQVFALGLEQIWWEQESTAGKKGPINLRAQQILMDSPQ